MSPETGGDDKGKTMISFQEYLYKFKTAKTSVFSHTSMMNPACCLYIPGCEEEAFLSMYNKMLQSGNTEMYITEKHRDISPVLIDLDFRFANNRQNEKRKYDEVLIRKVVETYVSCLSEYMETLTYDVYVMQKPKPVLDTKKNLLKDGIHIIIANVVTYPSLQLKIREECLSRLHFIESELNTTNSIEDIIDEAVIYKNNWLMYGSRKPHNEPYVVTYHWTYHVDEIGTIVSSIASAVKPDEPWYYTSILSIRNKYMLSDVRPCKREQVTQFEEDFQDSLRKKAIVLKSQQLKENPIMSTSDQYETAKKLLSILDSKRADDYNNWISVGWCCRNIDYRLLEDWIEFSKKSPKFGSEEDCITIWKHMKRGSLGIGSLCMWAKQDSPEEYTNCIRTSLYSVILTSASKADYDIALVIYNKFKQDFVCASIKHKSWYEFKNHRWVKCEDGYILKIKMSTEMSKDYLNLSSEFTSKAANCDDDTEQKNYLAKADAFREISTKLKKTDFKDKMLKECALQFFNEKFEDELLDANPNLIGFENGVYDLQNMEFREGHPEDYISFSTKINYVEYNPEDPLVEEIHDFLRKVLPNKEMREYMLTLMASMLDGNNKEEKFYIWTGHGSNGKSKCIELLEKVLGDYACTFNISLLTNKRVGSSQTNSELVRAKGRRFAVLQEPEEGEKMNAGFMKELSGNDKIIARGLYKESIEFKPMFKMVLTCNHLPQVPPEDGGTWRRIRLIEFNSHFCEHPNPENPKEFLIDRDLPFKFEDWKETFMSMLIEYFKKYKEHGIYEPEEVLQCTKNYQRSNDTIGEFSDAFVEKGSPDSFLYMDSLYDEYKEWHKNESVVGKVLRKKVIKEYFEKNLGKSQQSRDGILGWKGFKLSFSYKGIPFIDNSCDL
jgi:P4 family phage/plasmid primase-like protien